MRTFLSFFVVISLLFSANLPTSQPSQQGLSQERLERINTVMREHVESGRLPGASALLVRNGKVVFRGAWGEFKPDTMVRMYSMTKAITGVAAMMLYEEGKFTLMDPVSKYLPEFQDDGRGDDHRRVGQKGLFDCPSRNGRSRCAICSATPPGSTTRVR
jgi:CubicO group peptidase (beta-lactamase class C family)